MSIREKTDEVKQTIESLIENGSSYNLEELDRIYHPKLKVVMIDEDGSVAVSDKTANMKFFRLKRDSGAEPLSKWAQFNHIEVEGSTSQVVVIRKMELRNKPEKFILNILLEKENSRWQVIHETVFIQPAT